MTYHTGLPHETLYHLLAICFCLFHWVNTRKNTQTKNDSHHQKVTHGFLGARIIFSTFPVSNRGTIPCAQDGSSDHRRLKRCRKFVAKDSSPLQYMRLKIGDSRKMVVSLFSFWFPFNTTSRRLPSQKDTPTSTASASLNCDMCL